MRDPHLAEVVEIGAEADRGLGGVIEHQPARDREGALRDPLAVAERVAVRRFDRLPPFAHDVEVRRFELRHLAADVHEVDARVEPAEQAVRGVEQCQRVLVAAHRLHQQGELARRFRLVQHRAGADGELDRRAEPRFGESRPANKRCISEPEQGAEARLGELHRCELPPHCREGCLGMWCNSRSATHPVPKIRRGQTLGGGLLTKFERTRVPFVNPQESSNGRFHISLTGRIPARCVEAPESQTWKSRTFPVSRV